MTVENVKYTNVARTRFYNYIYIKRFSKKIADNPELGGGIVYTRIDYFHF